VPVNQVAHFLKSTSSKNEVSKGSGGQEGHELTFTTTGAVLKPVIDKLSCVFHFDHLGLQKKVHFKLKELLGNPSAPEYQKASYSTYKLGNYAMSVKLVDPTTQQAIVIQAQPKNDKTKSFMRFEWNPSKLGPGGMAFFRKQFSEMFGGTFTYADLLQQGKVTRVDAAVDFMNVSIDDVLIVTKTPEKSHVYYGTDGGTETIYLGASKYNKTGHTAIYDKQQQLEDVGRTEKYGGVPLTRIEARPKTFIHLGDLPSLPNPFNDINVIIPGRVEPPEEHHHWMFFLDSCRYLGIEGALSRLPDALIPKYEEALTQATQVSWDTDKVWSYWDEAVEKTGLLDS
jgi:hypothetical protein